MSDTETSPCGKSVVQFLNILIPGCLWLYQLEGRGLIPGSSSMYVKVSLGKTPNPLQCECCEVCTKKIL